MNKKVLIALAALFVVALIGQFIFSIYSNLIDKSSYTDWISAFCNVVMAGATVGAVLIASNYLAQFTAQEGYKIAIELVNDVFPKHEGLKTVVPLCNTALTIINKVLEQESVSGKEKNILYNTFMDIDLISKEVDLFYEEVKQLLFKIKTYGLHPSSEREYYFDNFIVNVELANLHLKQFVDELKLINKSVDEFYMSRNNGVTRENGVNFYYCDIAMDKIRDELLTSTLNELNASIEQMSSSHKNFIGKDNIITELFKVKRLLF
ncbi:hypothetical protein [Yersinia intermedia]|uniref:hypothetical protein n=1 Tax=Yersinia intermedia TaxID=631 RepID=UPI001CFCFDDE|nr:hypothetical protein [Yersinia intermedia]MCB5311820.1 hypothetical protein [Yersinia intermedia]MCB5327829.1 hypothetical protein [Yersinia intermedia]